MKFFARVRGRKVHCYVAAERRGGWAIQILLCGSLIPILLSFLMTINEDIYSAQFGSNPQNVEVCPSATFIGVDISRRAQTCRPSVTTNNILPNPKLVTFQSSEIHLLMMTMQMSAFVSPRRLIGCDDVELGKPYNLTVLHSYNCALCHSLTLLHVYTPINTFALLNCYTTLLRLQSSMEIRMERE